MTVAVVADAHLGGPGGSARPLIEQLSALPERGCQRLVLLGDLFQLWVGAERYETPDVLAFVECLRGLRAAGIRIDYVEGNRDFYLADSPYADAFDQVVTEVAFDAGGRRYLAVHGDGLDRRDWKYRFWRRFSKSSPIRFVVRRIPRRWARRLVDSTEQGLAKTNTEHKREIPREILTEYARLRLAEGHDCLLLGHFHEPHRWAVDDGEICLVDAWFRSRRVEWLG